MNSLSPIRSPTTNPINAGLGNQTTTLFEWELVSQFVVPRADICGRLTICTTKKHRIVGFPVMIWDEEKYGRGTFQFNVCFVFAKEVDVSCYEPIVRKLARVLTACENDHSFLSAPETKDKIYPILEQLFADLNSFSETSIRIDKYNSIELRIFPHYPNPPKVNSWDVPVPLIDIANRIEPNWDLTMRKVVPFINGVDHVKKIAQKAEADIDLVKECMAQVMMYQCVMMIDIFQFSNLYTLCRPVMWLFTDPAVYEECGPYVYKGPPDSSPPDWPQLAWYYARLKPPLTVGKWIRRHKIDVDKIDVRRFITFGVIKGFLRRVHRWPILLKDDRMMFTQVAPSIPPPQLTGFTPGVLARRRPKSTLFPQQALGYGEMLDGEPHPSNVSTHSGISEPPPKLGSSAEPVPPPQSIALPADQNPNVAGHNAAVANFSEKGLAADETKKGNDAFAAAIEKRFSDGKLATKVIGGISASNPASYASPSVLKARMGEYAYPPGMGNLQETQQSRGMGGGGKEEASTTDDTHAVSLPIAQELAAHAHQQQHAVTQLQLSRNQAIGSAGRINAGGLAVEVPPDLNELLDGTHHGDELCVHFGLSWNVLLGILAVIGGAPPPPSPSFDDDGAGECDLGRVKILYR